MFIHHLGDIFQYNLPKDKDRQPLDATTCMYTWRRGSNSGSEQRSEWGAVDSITRQTDQDHYLSRRWSHHNRHSGVTRRLMIVADRRVEARGQGGSRQRAPLSHAWDLLCSNTNYLTSSIMIHEKTIKFLIVYGKYIMWRRKRYRVNWNKKKTKK